VFVFVKHGIMLQSVKEFLHELKPGRECGIGWERETMRWLYEWETQILQSFHEVRVKKGEIK